VSYIGIDVSVNCTAVSSLVPGRSHRLELVETRILRKRVDGIRGLASRIASTVRDLGQPGTRVSIEVPPPTAKRSTRHGKQADIGWKLGYLTGLVDGYLDNQYQIRLVQVSTWRAAMLQLSTAWGIPASKPTEETSRKARARLVRIERELGRIFVVWSCGHRTATQFDRLNQAAQEGCTKCSESSAFDARDAWKELAVRLATKHWPHVIDPLIRDARSRARTVKPAHQLSGVPDACEATWIGASGMIEGLVDQEQDEPGSGDQD
jgi:hypothetical protein